MAIIYLDSSAAGAANGSSWTDAYTSFQTALNNWTTADIIYMSHTHDEGSVVAAGNVTYTCAAATDVNPVPVFSVNKSDDSYTPSAGTNFYTSTPASFAIAINFPIECHGIHLNAKRLDQSLTATGACSRYYDCTILSPSTSVGDYMYFLNMRCEFYNCTITNTSTGAMSVYAQTSPHIYFEGCSLSFTGNTYGLARAASNHGGNITFNNCDLTGFSSTQATFEADRYSRIEFNIVNCLLPASFSGSIVTDTANRGFKVTSKLVSSDDAGNLDRYEERHGDGSSIIATTATYRDSGYSGVDQQMSLKVSTSSKINQYIPLEIEYVIYGYVSTTGSKTFTMELVHDYSSSLEDNQVFFILEYLGTASETVGTSKTSATGGDFDILASGNTLASSSEIWTGASGLTKQKMSTTATINKAGLYRVKVFVAAYEAGKYIYIDPYVKVV